MSSILFVHNALKSFVKIDRDLLAEKWHVQELFLPSPQKINPFAVFRAVQRNDLVVAWFASWHSLLPIIFARLLKKPSIVIIGGYDTANLPEADYGSQRGGLSRFISRFVIRNASWLITNSNSAKQEAITNAKADTEKICVIYHGLPAVPAPQHDNHESIVLNVGEVKRANALRKGIQPFVQAAAYLPGVKFVQAGSWIGDLIDELRRDMPANVEFKGFVSDEELLDLYERASVYVQPSLHEGFGMSVAEAMLKGCIPVVTRCGSLPEVVGDTGVYATSNSPADVAQAIQTGLSMDPVWRQRARDRILNEFSIERRREAFHVKVESVLADTVN
ncbi:MAG: glycosyltransferase [Anaerolineaceae bacterium]|nr:glycosyltransferase [Anaerolineaceae bacterium]